MNLTDGKPNYEISSLYSFPTVCMVGLELGYNILSDNVPINAVTKQKLMQLDVNFH